MLKLMEIEPILDILRPIFEEKCDGVFAWELIELINELEPQVTKIDQLRKKLVETYALKNEDGTYQTNNAEGKEIYVFGENSEKVDSELKEVFEKEIEIEKSINLDHFKNIQIEPLKLKILIDKGLVKK